MSDPRLAGSNRLYGELASWWPLMSAPADYAEEASIFRRALDAAGTIPEGPSPRTLLELGSGGGNNAMHLAAHFEMTLVDLSEGMLDVSRKLNPGSEHVQGDMRTVRLGRRFDCVFVHDAICYMTSPSDVRAAIATVWAHCEPGGAAVLAPDYLRENFRPGTDCGGHDGDGRALRYLEWVWDPDPSDTTYLVDYAYLLRSADGPVELLHDRHVEGLFGRDEWLGWLEEVGFEARAVPLVHSEVEPGAHEYFVCRRPHRASAGE